MSCRGANTWGKCWDLVGGGQEGPGGPSNWTKPPGRGDGSADS